jgi:hypothetical protein
MLQASGIAQPSSEPQPQVPEPARVGVKRKSLPIKEEDRGDSEKDGDEDADEEEKALLVSTGVYHFLSISVKYTLFNPTLGQACGGSRKARPREPKPSTEESKERRYISQDEFYYSAWRGYRPHISMRLEVSINFGRYAQHLRLTFFIQSDIL